MSDKEFVFSKPRVFKRRYQKSSSSEPDSKISNKNNSNLFESIQSSKEIHHQEDDKENCMACASDNQCDCSFYETFRSSPNRSSSSIFNGESESSSLNGKLYKVDQILHCNHSNENNTSVIDVQDGYPQFDDNNHHEHNEQINEENLNDENIETDFLEQNKIRIQDILLNRSLKYKKFIAKRALFFNKLHIIPGIGFGYAKKLEKIIPNFGTLLELYSTVDEKKFKALLFKYAIINHRSLNLIYLSCQKYYEKYGSKFSDFSF